MNKFTLIAVLFGFVFLTGIRTSNAESKIMKPTQPFQEIIRTEVQPEFSVGGFSNFAGKAISMYVVSAVKNPMGGTPLVKELLAQPVTLEIPSTGSVTFPKMTVKSREDSPYNAVILIVHESVRDVIYPTNASNDAIIDHSRTLTSNDTLPQTSSSTVLLSRHLFRTQILKASKNSFASFTLGNDL